MKYLRDIYQSLFIDVLTHEVRLVCSTSQMEAHISQLASEKDIRSIATSLEKFQDKIKGFQRLAS